MKIEEIHDFWSQDAVLNEEDLAGESFKIAQIHAKYWRILTNERLSWEALRMSYAKLKKDKIQFYLHGPFKNKEDNRGWVHPPSGVIRQDLPFFLEADDDLLAIQTKIVYQKEKIELLLSILTNLGGRNWQLSNSVKYLERMDGK